MTDQNEIQPPSTRSWAVAPAPGSSLVPGSALRSEQLSYTTGANTDLNLGTIFRIISTWRWLILSAISVGLIGGIVASLLTTPLYRASAMLEVNPPTFEIMDQAKGEVASNDRDFLATQYGLLRSRSLAERVSEQLNLAGNAAVAGSGGSRDARNRAAADQLMAHFTVKPVPNSRLIQIAFSSAKADLAASVANAFADGFIASNLERRYEASSYARTFLERQIARTKTELEKSERDAVAYAQRQGIINTGSDRAAASDVNSLQGSSLVALNEALAQAQVKRISAQQAYEQSRSGGATQAANDSTQALRQQKATLESDYQDKLTRMKPDYPDMLSLRSRIDELNRQIATEARTVGSGRSKSLLEDYRAAAAAEGSLRGQVEQLRGSVLDLRGRSIQYTILQREVDTNRALYDALLQRYKEIGVAGGVGKNSVSIVDRAEVPSGPYKPKVMLNLAIGVGLGALFGLGVALLLEFVNDTIETPDDVRDKLKLPSLGVIPKKQGPNPIIEELQEQGSPVTEAYFSLRTSLQFSTDDGAPKTLLVTSTRPAEGKSSTTLALAQSFARLGNRVLLIDADLRKPAFVTGTDTIGLSNLLTSSERLADHVMDTQYDNLWLVPCGQLPPNPAELLASPRVRALVAEAAAEFDMVFIDGPPVLGLADAPLLGAACRGTLMVVESGKTRTRAAFDAVNRLRASGTHLVGAVLTKYRTRSGGYGYGYGYEPYKYGQVASDPAREIRLIASAKRES